MLIELTKYQALGNDYFVLDLPVPLEGVVPRLPTLCDRHLGPGSDGLLAFDPEAMSVRIFNPDGSEAQKSGNGLRITAAHAVLEPSAPDSFELETVGGANAVRIIGRQGPRVVSEVDIGRPSFEPADLPASLEPGDNGRVRLETPAGAVEAVLVSVGNPHCVILGEPVTKERCLELGPQLERHPAFPERTNVQLAEPLAREQARIEIWERGAGYTLASGTSAAAVAAALMREGLAADDIEVVMPGGRLSMRRNPDGRLMQTGPAQRVYRALVELDDLS